MVVFISSVRRGLESERDAIPGLIAALGHKPSRFEDFTALPVPPRQACLDGIYAADAYLLLLGQHYGDPMPDTGVAPTEEEFNAAVSTGIPIIVLRKAGVEMESAQAAFVQRVEAYATGRFRAVYASGEDLLTKTAAALRGLSEAPSAVELRQILNAPEVRWLGETGRSLPGRGANSTTLEVHLVPLGAPRLPASTLEEGAKRLIAVGRSSSIFRDDQAVTSGSDTETAWAAAQERGSSGAGLRIARSGTVTLWRELPRDSLGSIISVLSLTDQIAELLRAGSPIVRSQSDIAVTAALDPVAMAVEGETRDLGRRTKATISRFAMGGGAIRLAPEVAVASTQLQLAAKDIAHELAVRLLQAFRQG
jgi:Domain of unknown function (DUF4062)